MDRLPNCLPKEIPQRHFKTTEQGLPNPASVALHEAVGFRHVGTLGEVGRKFGRWIDTAWFQLDLAVGATEDDDRLT